MFTSIIIRLYLSVIYMLAVLVAENVLKFGLLSQEKAPNVGKIVYPCFEILTLDLLKLKLMPTPLQSVPPAYDTSPKILYELLFIT